MTTVFSNSMMSMMMRMCNMCMLCCAENQDRP